MNTKRVVRSRASRIGRDNDEGASRNGAMKSKLRGVTRCILCNHSYDIDYLIQVMLTALCLFSTWGNFFQYGVLGNRSSSEPGLKLQQRRSLRRALSCKKPGPIHAVRLKPISP
jgi:hypothetical protein